MAQTTALLALSLLLTVLSAFWAPTRAGDAQASISQSILAGQKGGIRIILTCNARGIQEPRHYNWSTNTGHLPPSAVPKGAQLLLWNEFIGITFFCLVSNGHNTANASWTFGFPSKQTNPYWAAVFVVLVILGGLPYAWYYRKSRQKQHSTLENEWTRLNPVPPEIYQQSADISRMFWTVRLQQYWRQTP